MNPTPGRSVSVSRSNSRSNMLPPTNVTQRTDSHQSVKSCWSTADKLNGRSLDTYSNKPQAADPALSEGGKGLKGQEGTIESLEEDHFSSRPPTRWERIRPYITAPGSRREKLVCLVFWLCLVGVILFLIIWGLPRFIRGTIEPMCDSIKERVPPAATAFICIFAIIILPLIFASKEPFEWLAAMVFPFWLAVVVVNVGTTLGIASGYWIGRLLMKERFNAFFLRYRMTRVLYIAVERVGSFKVGLLMRLSPLPYTPKNYLMGIPDAMYFWPYILASALAQAPGDVLAVYFGRNISGIADLLSGRPVPVAQMVVILVGLTSGFLILSVGSWYCNRLLKKLAMEQELSENQARILAASSTLEAFVVTHKGDQDPVLLAHHGVVVIGGTPYVTLAPAALPPPFESDDSLTTTSSSDAQLLPLFAAAGGTGSTFDGTAGQAPSSPELQRNSASGKRSTSASLHDRLVAGRISSVSGGSPPSPPPQQQQQRRTPTTPAGPGSGRHYAPPGSVLADSPSSFAPCSAAAADAGGNHVAATALPLRGVATFDSASSAVAPHTAFQMYELGGRGGKRDGEMEGGGTRRRLDLSPSGRGCDVEMGREPLIAGSLDQVSTSSPSGLPPRNPRSRPTSAAPAAALSSHEERTSRMPSPNGNSGGTSSRPTSAGSSGGDAAPVAPPAGLQPLDVGRRSGPMLSDDQEGGATYVKQLSAGRRPHLHPAERLDAPLADGGSGMADGGSQLGGGGGGGGARSPQGSLPNACGSPLSPRA